MGLLGARLYHALLGEVLKCNCGLPFASLRHLGLHSIACCVGSTTTQGPSLKSWFMHVWGSNYDQIDISVYQFKASWLMQTSFPGPKRSGNQEVPTFGRIARDADISMIRKLRNASPPTIALVRRSRYEDLDWTGTTKKVSMFG